MRCASLARASTALRPPQGWKALAKFAPALSAGCRGVAPPANAADKRQIASITASGLVFKDKLIVNAADPKVEGVTLYISASSGLSWRPKDFFRDLSRAASRAAPRAPRGQQPTSAEGKLSRRRVCCSRRSCEAIATRSEPLVCVYYSTRINKDDDNDEARFASSARTAWLCVENREKLPTNLSPTRGARRRLRRRAWRACP